MGNGFEELEISGDVLEAHRVRLAKDREFDSLKEGDRIQLKSGEIFIFQNHKRKNFSAISETNDRLYNIPNSLFEKIMEKAGPKQIDQGYKTLSPGELFCIKKGKDFIIYKFKEISKGRIQAVSVDGKMNWTIDIGLYHAKVSEL